MLLPSYMQLYKTINNLYIHIIATVFLHPIIVIIDNNNKNVKSERQTKPMNDGLVRLRKRTRLFNIF